MVDFSCFSRWKRSPSDQRMPGRLPVSTLLSTLCLLCLLLSFYVPCLSYSPSPSIFSITPPLFSPILSLMDPSDPSLLKMCLFPSFAFKDLACVRQRPGNMLLSPCDCDSLSGEADQNDSDLVRPHQTTLLDASAYQKSCRGHISIKHDLSQIMSQACLFRPLPPVYPATRCTPTLTLIPVTWTSRLFTHLFPASLLFSYYLNRSEAHACCQIIEHVSEWLPVCTVHAVNSRSCHLVCYCTCILLPVSCLPTCKPTVVIKMFHSTCLPTCVSGFDSSLPVLHTSALTA